MLHRKTDNTPVTDESLARVRDEIAEAYSHPSHETVTLDTESAVDRTMGLIAECDALRSQLDEAVALLRESVKYSGCYVDSVTRRKAFLSRLDSGGTR